MEEHEAHCKRAATVAQETLGEIRRPRRTRRGKDGLGGKIDKEKPFAGAARCFISSDEGEIPPEILNMSISDFSDIEDVAQVDEGDQRWRPTSVHEFP